MKSKVKVIYAGVSLELYRRENPDWCAEYTQSFARWREKLEEIAEVKASGTAYTAAELREILHRVPADEVDAVVLSPLSYTLSRTTWEALRECDLPLCLWSTQTMRRIAEDFLPEDLIRNHTVQGTQDITNVLFRRRCPFRIVTGHYADPEKLRLLEEELELCHALRRSGNIRCASIGGKFEGMDDFLFDPALVKEKFGWTFDVVPVEEYLRCWHEAEEEEVQELLRRDFAECEISPDLEPARHALSVRGYLALRRLRQNRGFDALTFNFQSFADLSPRAAIPFYGINRLMAEGCGYAGEGDALRAALMAEMRLLAEPVNFTEIYTVDFERQRMLMTHMQECNPACARKDRQLRLRSMPFFATDPESYSGMYFTVEPGPVTLATLTEDGVGGFRYIVFTGEVEDTPPLKNFNRAHWLLHVRDAADILDSYSRAGGTHHLTALPGDCRRRIRALAQMRNIECINLGGLE